MAHIGSQFALPENPIIRAYEDCGGLGAFMPYNPGWKQANQRPGGLQPPPSNAMKMGINPQGGLGDLGDCGCGCHGSGGAGSCQDDSLGIGLNGLNGLGFSIDETLSDTSNFLDSPSPILGLPWMYVLGGAALAFFLLSPVDNTDYRYEKSKALKRLRTKYPSRGRHAAQHVAAGGRAVKGLFS